MKLVMSDVLLVWTDTDLLHAANTEKSQMKKGAFDIFCYGKDRGILQIYVSSI